MEASPSPGPAAAGLRWWGQSHRGKVRKNNEDAFLGLQFDAREAHLLGRIGDGQLNTADFAFAVSDGMGGAMAGEFASRITVDKITKLLPRAFHLKARGLEAGFADVLEELFDEIHRALLFLGGSYEECTGMGATLSLCWFTPQWVFFGHVGDSRIYFLPGRSEGMQQVTHDDTHVGWLFRQGKLTEREARAHPGRNSLQKALGAGNHFAAPQVGAVSYEPGDQFLLCTDGLIEGLFDSQLEERLRSPDANEALQHPAERLVEAALARAGRDNLTALVVEAV